MTLDGRPLTWRCDICKDDRPDALIGVRHRPVQGLEHAYPDVRRNVKYCLDRKDCTDKAQVA